MTLLYNDLALGRSSIISENRQRRPNQVRGEDSCPFCIHNKSDIEKILMETHTPDGEYIRIVNNKYPVCHIEGPLYGMHDVVIETADHKKRPYNYSKAHWYSLIKLMQERWKVLETNPRIKFIQIFKNEGEEAGASIRHAHWQIIALEEVPYTMSRHYSGVEEAYHVGGCSLCKTEENDPFCIMENKMWRLIVPKGAGLPYESWIIPKKHISHFGQIEENDMEELSLVLRETLQLYECILPNLSYNVCVMSGRPHADDTYHFYIKVLPRTGNFAGFELATGCYINVLNPQKQAAIMQESLKRLRGNKDGDK